MKQIASISTPTFLFRRESHFMKPDYESLINAGLSKEEIAKISGCEDQEMQIRMLRKYRYKLLDEVHEKQQSLDVIDYMICKIKKQYRDEQNTLIQK
jgi:hypothetical protein